MQGQGDKLDNPNSSIQTSENQHLGDTVSTYQRQMISTLWASKVYIGLVIENAENDWIITSENRHGLRHNVTKSTDSVHNGNVFILKKKSIKLVILSTACDLCQ